jgi:hypothetical protein
MQSISIELVSEHIYLIRGQKVMLDSDLAALYGVPTKVLNQAVKRNRERFPEDFMFQLTKQETKTLGSQFVTSNRGGRRYQPYAFTQEGVAMLSSVLRSKQAIQVNIAIMRAFIRLRSILAAHKELAKKIEQLEKKYDARYVQILKLIDRYLKPAALPKPKIGFRTGKE